MHIESAPNFSRSTLREIYEKLDKHQTYYVICKSGVRSAQACQFLAEKGYDVVNVAAGMDAFEWELIPQRRVK
ncbi:rhodanese-related sulfurtransferase [Streptococcus australis]|uniref:Rhodanese-related sulfurtransferase n=1 Tax=Streptococcus australis TaxID=113107 RepID=A0A4V0BS93_9STRE|nr:rhodanese-related sulfurtransferase [Streptococcus australis]